jgi:hypothetical protein
MTLSRLGPLLCRVFFIALTYSDIGDSFGEWSIRIRSLSLFMATSLLEATFLSA